MTNTTASSSLITPTQDQLELYGEVGEFARNMLMNAFSLHCQRIGRTSITRPDFPRTIAPFLVTWFNYAMKSVQFEWGADEKLTSSLTVMMLTTAGEQLHAEDLLQHTLDLCIDALNNIDFGVIDPTRDHIDVLRTMSLLVSEHIKSRSHIASTYVKCTRKHESPLDGKYFAVEASATHQKAPSKKTLSPKSNLKK